MLADKFLQIIEHYGVNRQLKKLHEEIYELTEAILEHEEGVCSQFYDKNAITEEYADVMFMLIQFRLKYDIDLDRVNAIITEKTNRQVQRIEQEKPKKVNSSLKVGDTIKCVSAEDMVATMTELQKEGIETDFLYSLNGVRGLYLEVVKVGT